MTNAGRLDPAFLDSFLHIDSEFNMESLYGYIEGTGRPDDIAGWTTHLSECARCREYVAEFTEEWAAFNEPHEPGVQEWFVTMKATLDEWFEKLLQAPISSLVTATDFNEKQFNKETGQGSTFQFSEESYLSGKAEWAFSLAHKDNRYLLVSLKTAHPAYRDVSRVTFDLYCGEELVKLAKPLHPPLFSDDGQGLLTIDLQGSDTDITQYQAFSLRAVGVTLNFSRFSGKG